MFVTQTAFEPRWQGDSARVAALIDWFRMREWRVAIVHCHDPAQRHTDYRAMRQGVDSLDVYYPTREDLARRSESHLDAWCPDGLIDLVRHVLEREACDVLLVQCVFLSRCFEAVPRRKSTVRVLDADNIFSGRAALYQRAGLAYEWFSTHARDEIRGLARADLLLSIQETEARRLRMFAPRIPVMLVPHVHPVSSTRRPERDIILAVGAANVENHAGLLRFARESLPPIRAMRPAAHLYVAGQVGALLPTFDGVTCLGPVSDLAPWYERAAVVINTVPVGTGLKIKTVEALCHGVPLVSTPSGIQGLERFGRCFRVASDAQAFARETIDLLTHHAAAEALGRRAKRIASRYFDADRVLGPLEARLWGLMQRD
jgi:glycosyltransferase involved in cell wall biosynthesis